MSQTSLTKRIAVFSEDGHTLHINPGKGGKLPGSGQAEWMVHKGYKGWTTRHALNGIWREATGAEIVMAEAISSLLTMVEERG